MHADPPTHSHLHPRRPRRKLGGRLRCLFQPRLRPPAPRGPAPAASVFNFASRGDGRACGAACPCGGEPGSGGSIASAHVDVVPPRPAFPNRTWKSIKRVPSPPRGAENRAPDATLVSAVPGAGGRCAEMPGHTGTRDAAVAVVPARRRAPQTTRRRRRAGASGGRRGDLV